MKRITALLFIMGFLWVGSAWAATTVENGAGCLIVTIGAADFVWSTATVTTGFGAGVKVSDLYPNGIALTSIDFQGSAAAAKGVWRNRSVAGQKMGPPFYTIDGGPQTKYFTGKWMRKPCITYTDQTTDGAIWYFNFDPQ